MTLYYALPLIAWDYHRFFAFALNNILVRLYHQGIHIKESQWVEVRICV